MWGPRQDCGLPPCPVPGIFQSCESPVVPQPFMSLSLFLLMPESAIFSSFCIRASSSSALHPPAFQLPPTPGLLRVFRNHSSLSLLFSGLPGHSPPPRPASGPNRCGQGGESCRTKHVLHKEDLGWGGAFLSFSYIERLWAVSSFPSRGTISLSGSSAGFSITPPFTANRQALGPALKEAPRAKCTQPDMHGLLMHARQAPDGKPPSTSSTQQSL